MTFLPSPSKYALSDACGYPWSPHAPRWPKLPDSTYAGWGRAVSQAAQCLAVWGVAPFTDIALANDVDPGKLRRVGSMLSGLLVTDDATWRHAEVPIAYDASTGRSAIGIGRQAPDLVFGEPLTVRDYKSGYRQAADIDVRTDPQLRAYALFAARAHRRDRVHLEVVHVGEDGLTVDGVNLDEFDLAAIEAEVQDRLARPYHESVPTPGRHCFSRYCPIVSECPATKRALAQVDGAADASVVPLSAVITSLEHARSVRLRAKAASAALQNIEMAAREYVKQHGPVELEPGVWWGAVQKDGKRTVELSTAAQEVLAKHLGDFGAAAAVETSTTLTAIQRAVKSVADKGKAAALERELLAELERVGALRRGAPYTVVEEFKRRNGS